MDIQNSLNFKEVPDYDVLKTAIEDAVDTIDTVQNAYSYASNLPTEWLYTKPIQAYTAYLRSLEELVESPEFILSCTNLLGLLKDTCDRAGVTEVPTYFVDIHHKYVYHVNVNKLDVTTYEDLTGQTFYSLTYEDGCIVYTLIESQYFDVFEAKIYDLIERIKNV
jgi:hypothetical protein